VLKPCIIIIVIIIIIIIIMPLSLMFDVMYRGSAEEHW